MRLLLHEVHLYGSSTVADFGEYIQLQCVILRKRPRLRYKLKLVSDMIRIIMKGII